MSSGKKFRKETKSSQKDKMMVLLEDIKGQVSTVAEGHSVFKNEINALGLRIEERIDGIELKIGEGFKLVLEHLDGLDKEFIELKKEIKNNYERKGHDLGWRKAIEERVEKLEKIFAARKSVKA